MSFRCLRAAGALPAALLLAACGGGADDLLPPVQVAAAATPDRITLLGCVADQHFLPRTGVTVHALAADGRLLATAISDHEGLIRFRLAPLQTVTVAVDGAEDGRLEVPVGRSNFAVGACLQARDG